MTKEESEARVREAVARAEEEIYGCPLLQKAMARVEAEALGLASPEKENALEEKDAGRDFGCQGRNSTDCLSLKQIFRPPFWFSFTFTLLSRPSKE